VLEYRSEVLFCRERSQALQDSALIVLQVGFEQIMTCKVCASENLQELAGELSASFPDMKRANIQPIYVCQQVVVCLDCGLAEIVIPAAELELLKRGRASSGS
jgi:hypothetical protein